MKITKKQLKALIREQVAAVLEGVGKYHEDEWFDILAGERGSPISFDPDGTEASMTPNEEVQAEIALSSAIDILHGLGYSEKDLVDLVKDLIPRASGDHPSWEDDASHPDSPDYEEEETVKIGAPQHDPMDRSALGKYRRGKMTNFAEENKPSSGLTKKKKSKIAKKARKGGDVGKKGKNFDKVADKAAKKYGSKEAGERVAAAAMWKNAKR